MSTVSSKSPARILYPGLMLLLLLSLPARAEQVMEIIPLKHALLSDLIPILQPLVDDDGTITGMHDQLIIRTSPENLEQLKTVLARLDQRQQDLLITVRRDDGSEQQYQDTRGNLHYRSGPGTSSGNVSLQHDNHYSTRSQQSDQILRTRAGSPAWIQIGTDLPVNERTIYIGPWQTLIQDSIRYEPTGTGFHVVPRVSGDRVTLHISPQQRRLNTDLSGQAAFDSRGLDTLASGQLGEWIYLGGIDETGSHQQDGTLSSTRNQQQSRYGIWVKVETAR